MEVCKEAEAEWCDSIQTALGKAVLTRSCNNHVCLFRFEKRPRQALRRYSNIRTSKAAGMFFPIRSAHFGFGQTHVDFGTTHSNPDPTQPNPTHWVTHWGPKIVQTKQTKISYT
jgi:hypothetical protein